MSATCVVGLDPSLTAAGVAVICHPATASTPNVPRCGSVGAGGSRGASLSERACRVGDQRDRIVRAMPPKIALVVIEALPMVPPKPEYASNYQERAALILELVEFLARRRIPVAEVNVSTLKLWATGHGRAEKSAVHAAMVEMWPGADLWTPRGKRDENRSDALSLASMGAMHLGWHEPELTHHYAPKVAWPNGIEKRSA